MDKTLEPQNDTAASDDKHWRYTFWYVVGTTFIVLAYVIIITFCKIPPDNVRFVDTCLGFLLGTFLAGGAGYLVGGSSIVPPSALKKGTSGDTLSIGNTTTVLPTPAEPGSTDAPPAQIQSA